MELRFLTPARMEFTEAVAFYESEARGVSNQFIEELDRATERIMHNPLLGAPHVENTRRLLLRRFPYSIVYRTYSDFILIVAIAHQKRRPNYWQEWLR